MGILYTNCYICIIFHIIFNLIFHFTFHIIFNDNNNLHPIIVENNGDRNTFLNSLDCDVIIQIIIK